MSFLCILRSFLKVKVQNGGYFWGLLKYQIFFGVLDIPDIFWGWRASAGPEPTYEEKMKLPPRGGSPIPHLDPHMILNPGSAIDLCGGSGWLIVNTYQMIFMRSNILRHRHCRCSKAPPIQLENVNTNFNHRILNYRVRTIKLMNEKL